MSQVKAGGAYVELTARSTQFLKGLEAAQKRLKSFGASTRLLGTKLTGLGVASATPIAGSLVAYTNFDDANGADFKRFSSIQILDPAEIVAGKLPTP